MRSAAQAAPGGSVEPHRIPVPDYLSEDLDALVELVSRRTGERPSAVRRAVEITVLTLGIRALEEREGKR